MIQLMSTWMWHIQGKELEFIKGKDHPRRGYEGPEREEV